MMNRILASKIVVRLTRDKVALALFLAAAVFRFYHLGAKSLSLDEVFAADTTRFGSFREVLDWAMTDPQEMPLVNIIAWMLRWLGNGEWVVRLPAAVTSTFSVVALYALCKAMGRPRTGVVAGLLLVIFPYSVWFAQEARPYAFLMLLAPLQMLFAFRAARFNGWRDWLWLAACSIVNIYSHILALAATGAAFLFVGLVLCLPVAGAALAVLPRIVGRLLAGALPSFRLRVRTGEDGPIRDGHLRVVFDGAGPVSPRLRRLARRAAPKLVAAAVSAVIVLLAYVPWIPQLTEFLLKNAAVAATGGPAPPATMAGGLTWLAGLGFSGIVLVLLAAGIATAAVDVFRGRWKQTLLIAVWMAVPLGIFWVQLGGGLFTAYGKYFACVVPAGVLLVAMGVEGLTEVIQYLVRHSRGSLRRPALVGATPALASLGISALLFFQVFPALVRTYAAGKDDYRGLADHVIAAGPGDSTVLAVGNCGAYVVKALPYYFRIRRSPIAVIDGSQVDDRAIERLTKAKGPVWAVRFTACNPPDSMDLASKTAVEILPFNGLDLARQKTPGPTSMAQAAAVLDWAKPFHPAVAPSLELARAFSTGRQLGENLLPPIEAKTWDVPPAPLAQRSADQQGFILSPKAGEINVTYKLDTDVVVPGRLFVISFEYRNGGFKGQQKVYLSTHTQTGEWKDVFPDGAGYLCSPAQEWRPAAFAFTVPPTVVMIQAWLRATGDGPAEFRAVKLRRLL